MEYCYVLRSVKKSLITMVDRYAIGEGFKLALSADMRFAADTPKFGAVEIKLGWIGGGKMGLIEAVKPFKELQAKEFNKVDF